MSGALQMFRASDLAMVLQTKKFAKVNFWDKVEVAAIIPVFPVVPVIPVVPAFWSFQLSGRSSFPIVPA
jgi:hypothetical protein